MDMNRLHYVLCAVLGVSALAVSCNKDNIAPSDTSLTGKTIQIEVGMPDGGVTKGFSDKDGLVWEVGDQIKCSFSDLKSKPLTAEDITDGGKTAKFTFDAALIAEDRTCWFISTNNHPGNNDEVEFTLGVDNGNVYTQDEAGKMNARRLFLHSGTGLVQIKKDEVPIVKMDIPGSIFRVIPYTSKYNDETILSVEMSSNSYIVGTVSYDRGAGTYKPIANEGYTGATIDWRKYQNVVVNLGTPFALESVASKETSKGVYIPIAATPQGYQYKGYKFVVTTDKAVYTFDAMDEMLTVNENEVVNVPLNLDKGARVVDAGELQYVFAVNNITVAADGVIDYDAGYAYAQIRKDASSDWETKEGTLNQMYYGSVVFDCKDAVTGEPVDWLTVRYPGNGQTHWLVSAVANTGAERKAVVTATYTSVKGYEIAESSKTKSITVTQAAAGTKSTVTIGELAMGGSFERVYEGDAVVNNNIGYSLLYVDGQLTKNWTVEGNPYSKVRFMFVDEATYKKEDYRVNTVDWLRCSFLYNDAGVMQDCIWLVSLDANTTGSDRVGYIVMTFVDDGAYNYPNPRAVKVTQKAKKDIVAQFTSSYTGIVDKEGETIVAGKLALSINGVAQTDIKAAIESNGIEASATNASVSIAADGAISLVVNKNYSTVERNVTFTLKYNGKDLITPAVYTQAAGEGGGAECPYTYSLEIVNPNGFGYGPNVKGDGNWAYIRNIAKDGKVIDPINETIANEVLSFAFRPEIPTDEERAAVNCPASKKASTTAMSLRVRWCGGTQVDLTIDSSEGGCVTKFTAYSSDGNIFGHFIVWTD